MITFEEFLRNVLKMFEETEQALIADYVSLTISYKARVTKTLIVQTNL